MTGDQYAFTDLIDEMEAAEQAKVDQHRTQVQSFFDALSEEHQRELAEMMHRSTWLTFQALEAAAGDWFQSRQVRSVGEHRGTQCAL